MSLPIARTTEQVPASLDLRRHTTGDDTDTVEAVLTLLEQTLEELTAQWRTLSSAVVPRPDVLHTDSILSLVRDFATAPGKLLRPRMAHWGWASAGGLDHGRGHHDVIQLGAALELLHCFALVHDDVMDASETRRGRPSVHALARAEHRELGGLGDPQRYAENIAILVGDLLHSEADVLIGALPSRLRTAWRTMTIELMMGQGRDLVGAANGRRDLRHAHEVARTKSGAYTVWRPLQLGALAGGGSPELLGALQDYAEHAGQAFALRDDVLGVIGDPERTGKPVGDDLLAGKPTVLLALAQQRFSPSLRLQLRRVGREPVTADQATELSEELRRSGVIDEVEQLIAAAVLAAEQALASPLVDPRAAEGLRDLVARLAWRES
ncbi:MAG: polyprenyl synthetase family protein [Micropruina sp.]|uniref:polyprenyl synthetase family protein n=1 Tax=Micropruina sp. TaxID=2737536 RepID=UPI0039E25179